MTDYAITYEVPDFGTDGIEAEEDLYTHIILSQKTVNSTVQKDILILPEGYQKIDLDDTELAKEYLLLRKTDDNTGHDHLIIVQTLQGTSEADLQTRVQLVGEDENA